MPAGRPSKYSKTYCDEAISVLGQGHSIGALAGELGVARATIFNWMDEYPEFLDAVKKGQAKSAKFWEEKLLQVASGTADGNVVSIIFGLKTRAHEDWRDTTETEHSGDVSITVDTGIDRG